MYFLSPVYKKMPLSHKIAYTAVMAAMAVLGNIFSIDIAGGLFKLSFVSTISLLSGALFGPIIGFAIGFLGDALAFLVFSSGIYSPLIGISSGFIALISGTVFALCKDKGIALKVFLSALIAYFVCTLFITSVGIYILFPIKSTFFAYMLKRIMFQTPVNIANALISYFLIKSLIKVKLMRLSVS